MLYYDETKNPAGAYLPGVPLADLDDEQLAGYPDWLQASIKAAGFWSEKKPARHAPPNAPAVAADKE